MPALLFPPGRLRGNLSRYRKSPEDHLPGIFSSALVLVLILVLVLVLLILLVFALLILVLIAILVVIHNVFLPK